MLKDNESQERLALAKRLREILSDRGDKTAIAEKCGVSNQAVNGWVSTGRINKKHLTDIAKLKGVRLEWLITGNGDKCLQADKRSPPQAFSQEEIECLALFDGLTRDQQQEILHTMQRQVRENAKLYEEISAKKNRKLK